MAKNKVDIHAGKLAKRKKTYEEEQTLRRTQKGIFDFKGKEEKKK